MSRPRDAREAGTLARQRGGLRRENPYHRESLPAALWDEGWLLEDCRILELCYATAGGLDRPPAPGYEGDDPATELRRAALGNGRP